MLSRRSFLQAHAAGFALPLAGAAAPARPSIGGSALPSGTQTGHPSASAKRQYWNDWPNYLTAQVNAARERRKALLSSIRSGAQVRERAEFVRRKVWELIGGPLDRTPLNASVVGTVERGHYRIEKVVFESQPQVYVTAHLYVPGSGTSPYPCVLAPLGHAPQGKLYRNYQAVYQTLARKGYVVLAFDPFGQGERRQYLDPRTGRSRLGPTGEHTQAGRPLLLLGATFAQYRVWDAVRALDYLLSRPEVDSGRVGCTGHSGGGTLTMYLCALEPRIQVAVEVQGNSENLAGPDYDPPGAVADAEQNLVGSLEVGLDRGDLLWAFTPKPLLLCYTPQDSGSTYSPRYEQSTREILEELRAAYTILGADEKVQLFASPFPHDYDFITRRAAYDWFNRWLANKDLGTDEAPFDDSPGEALNCTSTGQVLTSLGGRSLVQINAERAHAVAASRALTRGFKDLKERRQQVVTALRGLLGLPSNVVPLHPELLSSTLVRGRAIEEFEFRSEQEIRVPGWFVKPKEGTPPFSTVLCVSNRGKDGLVEEPGELDALFGRGYAVCGIDPRGVGVTAPRFPVAGPRFYDEEHLDEDYAWVGLALGKPALGQRVWDLIRCTDYLETRPDVDRSRIYLLGVDTCALVALLAAALDPRFRALLIERMLADFTSVLECGEYTWQLSGCVFGILRQLDLPDLVACLPPRPCWILNPRGPNAEPIPQSAISERYQVAVGAYRDAGLQDRIRFLVRADEERLQVLGAWLGNS